MEWSADMTQEAEASLIGILLTDGCVSPKGTSWRVIVSNNSRAIVDRFEETTAICFEKSIRRAVRGKLHVGVLDSKEVGQRLIDRYGTFRTESCQAHQGCPYLRGGPKPCRHCDPVLHDGIAYPPATLPDFSSDSEAIAFLQSAFSCDGGVNLYVARRARVRWLIRNVYLACKHPVLIFQYASLLTRLGIKARVLPSDWRVMVQGREPISRYANMIGFLPGAIIGANSPFWHGRTKADVLALLLESYGNPREIYDLPQFSTENMG
jgi:hypothetical protein